MIHIPRAARVVHSRYRGRSQGELSVVYYSPFRGIDEAGVAVGAFASSGDRFVCYVEFFTSGAARQENTTHMAKTNGTYRFTFGPWNISEGEDPFGPPVRKPLAFAKKLKLVKKLGYGGMQFHDDDAVPDIDEKSSSQIVKEAKQLKKILDGEGVEAEFIAPRLWFSPKTVDGAYTSNEPSHRKYAIDRTKRSIELCELLGTRRLVLWLAREGTYIRNSKDPVLQVQRIRDAVDVFLESDPTIQVLIEPKPNEPVDSAIIPTIGHAIGLSYMTREPQRVGVLCESAHSMLAGLEPAEDMGYALAHGKLWGVHLNDQNGLKFDQDKSFGSNNLRRAFDQVRVLEEYGYGNNGEWVGFDVKTMRTQKQSVNTKHLSGSLATFKNLLKKVQTFNRKLEAELIKARDYEELDHYTLCHLMGVKY